MTKKILFLLSIIFLVGCKTTHSATTEKTNGLQLSEAYFDEGLLQLNQSVEEVIPLAKKYLKAGDTSSQKKLMIALCEYSSCLKLLGFRGMNAEQEKTKRTIVMKYLRAFTPQERAKIFTDFPFNYDAGLD